jgi:E3 ubiquitin-protein ligase listerin
MSRVVGAWVAGQYDNDRLVARIAQDSLTQVFPTEEKRRMLWRAYQSALLGYVDDAALQQTAQTLSDERTMSPDDSMAKHVRVAASAIFVLRNVMSESRAPSSFAQKHVL